MAYVFFFTVKLLALSLWYDFLPDGDNSSHILQSSESFTDRSTHGNDHENGGDVHYFILSDILAATNNFSDANKLGEGGFGPVYKVRRYVMFLIAYLCLELRLQ